jgi:transposase-like protein
MSKKEESLNKQHRYPWPVIETAVKLALGDQLAYRAVSEKMAEMGVSVSHKTVFEWAQKFQDVVDLKTRRRGVNYSLEESYVKCNNNWMYMYRAVASKDATLGVFLRERKSMISAKKYFEKQFQA